VLYSQTTPLIGIALERFDGNYQSSVVQGLCDAARERGVNVFAFVGGQLGVEPRRSRVFELIGPESVNGLVLLGAVLCHHAGLDAVQAFSGAFDPLPMASVGTSLPGSAAVLIDNQTGLRDAVDHLIQRHGRKRIAFVRGPATILEAEQRFAAYREALERAALAFDAGLVCNGDFARASGAEAVRALLDERHLSPDAIVAANDAMACGAIDELARRGLRVPRDLSVIGFDDSEEARYSEPPLTTVRQPERELGREALRIVLSRSGPAGSVVLPTELVRRRSCGCFGGETPVSAAPAAPASTLGFQAALIERRQSLLAELARAARGQFGVLGRGWEASLLGALNDDILGAPGSFLSQYDEIVARCQSAHVDVGVCHDVLTVLRRQLMACLTGDVERRNLADRLLDEARISVSRAAERVQANERLALAAHLPALSELCVDLAAARSLSELGSVLGRSARLGVAECHLLLYDGSEYRLALSHSERCGLRFPGISGQPRNLLRRSLPEHGHHALAVLPLFSGERHHGFVSLTLGARLPLPHEALRSAFSHALDAMRA
jgi:phosphoserine phosphatase RsbU/P